jgi:hypothetical protein
MRNAFTNVLTTIVLALAAATAAAAERSADPAAATSAAGFARARVQVRVYDTTVMPAADQTVALRAAAGVLAAAGIDVTWVMCRRNGDDSPRACELPLDRSELSVRLVRLPGVTSNRGELELGYSLVDTSVAAGALATVYADRVQWLSAKAGVDGATVLGMAVAHEIGHLLLGTNNHGTTGIMRALWTTKELQRRDTSDWMFSPVESATMLRSLRERQLQMAANITWE